MKLAPLVALTAAALAPACTDDGRRARPGPQVITWRVPCGARGQWSDGLVETSVYVNDARRHQIEATTVDAAGVQRSHVTRGYDGDRFLWSDVVTRSLNYTNRVSYAGDLMIGAVFTDRSAASGGFGYTAAYGYDGDAMVTADIDYVDPALADIHSTITGDLTERQVAVDCEVDDPAACDTYVYEQPDGDPDHWVASTLDLGSDGILDYRDVRTLDRHGLELTWREYDLAGGGEVLNYQAMTVRDADGTVLSRSVDRLDAAGAVVDTFVVTNLFDCPAARPAPVAGAAGLHAAAAGDRAVPTRRQPAWRSDRGR